MFMKHYLTIISILVVCGTAIAEKGDLYGKGTISVLNMKADMKSVDYVTQIDEFYDEEPPLYEEDTSLGPVGSTVQTSSTGDAKLDGIGYLLELGGSYELIDALRLEGSLGFGMVGLDSDGGDETIKTDISTFVGFLDANYYFSNLFMKDSAFSFYTGFGIGFAMNTVDDTTVTAPAGVKTVFEGDSSTGFAWRFNLGAEYALADTWSLYLAYQYMDIGTATGEKKGTWKDTDGSTGTFTSSNAPEYDLYSHVFSLGAKYIF